MEWNIFIEQNILTEFQEKARQCGKFIDVIDGIIISAIFKYQNPDEMPGLHRNENGFVYINHQWFLDKFPLLGISVETLRRRLKKLVELGIIERDYMYPVGDNGIRRKALYHTSKVFSDLRAWWQEHKDIITDKNLNELERASKLQIHKQNKPRLPDYQKKTAHKDQLRFKDGTFSIEHPYERSYVTVHSGHRRPFTAVTGDRVVIDYKKDTKEKKTTSALPTEALAEEDSYKFCPSCKKDIDVNTRIAKGQIHCPYCNHILHKKLVDFVLSLREEAVKESEAV